ncbi:3'-5' exonuclease [Roseovarius tibetensis]|uniref:3'-5' exonuclease n=1 Tax=Roseovarius tibetensis TaxID=2685897 RepID=UPI003D7FCB86
MAGTDHRGGTEPAGSSHDSGDWPEIGIEARLLAEGSSGFSTGIIICTPHLAKGLEFDRVLIPDASEAVFSTEMDRNLLYVACTRAMHRLEMISVGAPSKLLPPIAHA